MGVGAGAEAGARARAKVCDRDNTIPNEVNCG